MTTTIMMVVSGGGVDDWLDSPIGRPWRRRVSPALEVFSTRPWWPTRRQVTFSQTWHTRQFWGALVTISGCEWIFRLWHGLPLCSGSLRLGARRGFGRLRGQCLRVWPWGSGRAPLGLLQDGFGPRPPADEGVGASRPGSFGAHEPGQEAA